MPRGGKRPNAGRKVGSLTKRTRDIAEAAAASGETPLDYMLRVMRDPAVDDGRRDEMAKSAASFIHAKLASTHVTADANALVPSVVFTTLYEDGSGNVSVTPPRQRPPTQ
jgi:hypothetical protein